MLYPTDTVYAIGCDLRDKGALERVRQIKRLSNDKPLTFLCPSLANIATYAHISDPNYRLVRRLVPGPYTFLLPASKAVPRLVMNPKRKTTGIRVPDHKLCLALLTELGSPIVSTSAHVSANAEPQPISKVELWDSLAKLVDLIIDDGTEPGSQVSTILDLTGDEPLLVRRGLGWDLAVSYLNPKA